MGTSRLLTACRAAGRGAIASLTVAGALSGGLLGAAAVTGVSVDPAVAATPACPCSLWSSTTTPAVTDSGDNSAVELGVQFSAQTSGWITGVRFYKAAANTGIHIGSLWTSTGSLLAQATFNDESGSGWQDVSFSAPVAITANTTYVAGYHTNVGHYSYDSGYFASGAYTNAPLSAPGGSGSTNGVFAYSPTPTFPGSTNNGDNYWVDVDFSTTQPVPSQPTCPCSLWPSAPTPAVIDSGDPQAAELGVAWTPSVNGVVSAIRFYKSAANTGTHIGSLWTDTTSPTLLASATFGSETASGWQQVTLSPPVAVSAGQTYVAGYHTNTGHYAVDKGYFANSGYSSPPLAAPGGNPSNPNGLYAYSPTPTFPGSTYNGNNYWVDVVFSPSRVATGIKISGADLAVPAGTSEPLSATETFSDGTTLDVTGQVAWSSSNPSVLSVSPTGAVTANSQGSAQAIARLGPLQSSLTLNVLAPIGWLSVVPVASALLPGQTRQMEASAWLRDGTRVDVSALASWSTLPWSPISVSSTGLVTAHSPGVGVVRASVGTYCATGWVGVLWWPFNH